MVGCCRPRRGGGRFRRVQDALHLPPQGIDVEGLADDRSRSDVRRIGVAGHHQHGARLEQPLAGRCAEQLGTRLIRQLVIADHQAEAPLAEQPQAAIGVAGLAHLPPVPGQRRRHQVARVGVVVDQEDARGRRGGGRGRAFLRDGTGPLERCRQDALPGVAIHSREVQPACQNNAAATSCGAVAQPQFLPCVGADGVGSLRRCGT